MIHMNMRDSVQLFVIMFVAMSLVQGQLFPFLKNSEKERDRQMSEKCLISINA